MQTHSELGSSSFNSQLRQYQITFDVYQKKKGWQTQFISYSSQPIKTSKCSRISNNKRSRAISPPTQIIRVQIQIFNRVQIYLTIYCKFFIFRECSKQSSKCQKSCFESNLKLTKCCCGFVISFLSNNILQVLAFKIQKF